MRKGAANSGRRGSRCYIESIFPEDSEGRELGATESAKGSLVSSAAEWKLLGVCQRNMEAGESKNGRNFGDQRRNSKARIWRIRGLDLGGTAHAQERICAILVRGTEVRWPGKKRPTDRIRYKEEGIETDVNTGAVA